MNTAGKQRFAGSSAGYHRSNQLNDCGVSYLNRLIPPAFRKGNDNHHFTITNGETDIICINDVLLL